VFVVGGFINSFVYVSVDWASSRTHSLKVLGMLGGCAFCVFFWVFMKWFVRFGLFVGWLVNVFWLFGVFFCVSV